MKWTSFLRNKETLRRQRAWYWRNDKRCRLYLENVQRPVISKTFSKLADGFGSDYQIQHVTMWLKRLRIALSRFYGESANISLFFVLANTFVKSFIIENLQDLKNASKEYFYFINFLALDLQKDRAFSVSSVLFHLSNIKNSKGVFRILSNI